MINKVMSASDIPTPYACYGEEKSLSKNHFVVGETVYLPFFVRDNMTGQTIQVKLTDPLGGVVYEYAVPTGNTYYPNCWYYYYFTSLTTLGKWTFSVTYGNNSVAHSFTINSALPVKLRTFSLEESEENVRLLWETTEELNADKFVIERSADTRTFETIAAVPAKRLTSEETATAYAFDDEAPLGGLNYYRLKMMDLDGSFAYSKILSATLGQRNQVTIMPNPTSKSVFVQGNAVSSIELLDQKGKLWLSRKRLKGSVPHELDVRHMPAGLYVLKTTDDRGSKQTSKLVIK